jgi:hypothetical protein
LLPPPLGLKYVGSTLELVIWAGSKSCWYKTHRVVREGAKRGSMKEKKDFSKSLEESKRYRMMKGELQRT